MSVRSFHAPFMLNAGVLADLEETYEWVVVVGHHPINQVDVYDFQTLLQGIHGADIRAMVNGRI